MYLKINYDIVSLIGAMTYCKKHKKLFNNVSKYLNKGGVFIFTQRTDLWDMLDFNQKLIDICKLLNADRFIVKPNTESYHPKQFFEQIVTMENSNPQIKLEAQRRIQRDFSE